MLRMELPGKGKRGWPKRRFMDAVREHMAGMEEEVRTKMGTKSAVATPGGRSRKQKSEIFEI